MKTKSREFYIEKWQFYKMAMGSHVPDLSIYSPDGPVPVDSVSITISWKILEKKIEITESDFDKAWESVGLIGSSNHHLMKDMLFNKENER